MAESRFEIWFLAARPKTLWAAVGPVLIGSAMAYGDVIPIDRLSVLCALTGALLIQIGTNLSNDYFDFVKGTDTVHRIGPTRATQAGMVSPDAMRRAYRIAFGLALIPGAYIVWRGGWPFVIIGLLSIAAGVLYTAGPYPLGYVGLGDFFVLIFFGPVAVGGTYYLHALEITPPVLVAGFAPGLISVALLTVNNLRDMEEDRAAGKKTLAVRFGRQFARIEYLVSMLVAAFIIPLYFYGVNGSRFFLLVPLIVVTAATPAIKTVFTATDGASLNRVLATTGKLLLVFSLVFSLGWIL